MFYVLAPFFFFFGIGCLLGLIYISFQAVQILGPIMISCIIDIPKAWAKAFKEGWNEGGGKS